MVSKQQLQIVYGITIALLVIGVIAYAAAPTGAPDQPIRIMFKNVGGNVLFDHKTHTHDSGYGISCLDCHHTSEEGETQPERCSDCHESSSDDEDMPNRTDAFHIMCKNCHADLEVETAPVDCSGCHFTTN